jgi:DNA-binding NtrC family response regulator
VKSILSTASNPAFEASLIEFSEEALVKLKGYHWPGNLSELAQLVNKIAATTTTRVVNADQLPLRLKEIKDWPKLADYLASQETQYIEMVLNACRGDQASAAKVLGVDSARLLK